MRSHFKILLSFLLFTTAGLSARAGTPEENGDIDSNSRRMFERGREIFRYDTFGSEAYWGDQLKLHDAIKGAKNGGVGPGLSPKAALAAGLKVDTGRLSQELLNAIKAGKVDLDDPNTTLVLLKADAVVGVKGFFAGNNLKSVGLRCAVCHSTTDDSFAPGLGKRLDGWPNRDLNVGAIVSMAPNLKPLENALGVDEATLKKVLSSWGPGRYDAEVNMDLKAFRPDGKSASTLIPAAFGMAGVNLHTYTGWGSVTHWNAYVAVTQMHGQGTFFDPRLNDKTKFPLAVKNGTWNVRSNPDLVTSKLADLQFYQLALSAPVPSKGSYDKYMAKRGEAIFNGKAKCMTCHVPPLYTEPGQNMHTPAEIGIDDFQAKRSPDERYRTTPLKGLFVREKGGFYHDGRYANYREVIDHYDSVKKLDLSENEKMDLEQFLKSL
ncbi:MAG: hypothetical protein ACXVLQ_17785 [Bacteriovorax sp.]